VTLACDLVLDLNERGEMEDGEGGRERRNERLN
jgi:hypothetical protein